MSGFLCSSGRYLIQGVVIERPGIGAPEVLSKQGNPKMRLTKSEKAALDEFWDALKAGTQEKYRVGGGCVRLEDASGR